MIEVFPNFSIKDERTTNAIEMSVPVPIEEVEMSVTSEDVEISETSKTVEMSGTSEDVEMNESSSERSFEGEMIIQLKFGDIVS